MADFDASWHLDAQHQPFELAAKATTADVPADW
jgi:hypothetical protein